ncbi:MAG: hypothetical protein IPH42_10985 [Bacteroidetes bacterium]|nr:hypothetical protein [Bacteroidota bacterium]
MSNYEELLKNKLDDSLIIYFEEVISGAKNFKLLSNYLKHYRHGDDKRHGFDYLFSLIDRTPFNTRQEILKKLESNKNKVSEKAFISYFQLNVPVIEAAHLGNPLEDKVSDLKQMIEESHLDVLKLKISYELPPRDGKQLPEEKLQDELKEDDLKYFPFEKDDNISEEVYNLYKDILTNRKFDLLKLYAAHEINTYLSDDDLLSKKSFDLETIIESIWLKMRFREKFFTTELNSESRNKTINLERDLLHDTIIKILSRQPFTYFHKIDNSVFYYCLEKLEVEINTIESNNYRLNFGNLRLIKFYIRRLMELDSSVLISKKILTTIMSFYEKGKSGISPLQMLANDLLDKLFKYNQNSISISPQDELTKNNLYYKIEQVNSFTSFLLYCFKETTFKNHYRSIKLEGLINSDAYLPAIIKSNNCENTELLKLVQDPYYLVTGIIKAENIYLLNKMKELHIEKLEKYFDAVEKYKEINLEKLAIQEYSQKYFDNWLNPFLSDSILNFYFESWKSDPVILNAQRFIEESRFNKSINENIVDEGFAQIKLAVSNMLKSVSLFKVRNKGKEFNVEIKDIIQSIVSILQPGIEESHISPGTKESKLGFSLCIKYNSNTDNEGDINNILVISSDASSNGAKLSKHGLIHHFMDGIFTANPAYINSVNSNSKNKNVANELLTEQSLLAAININNEYHSFNQEYFVRDINSKEIPQSIESLKQKTFNELYTHDSQVENGIGLPFLSGKKLSLFFRLSSIEEVTNSNNETKFYSKGKAVLIITLNEEVNLVNYRKFMSNEKVRLLLLIKEDFLNYLSSIFESTTFWDLVNSKKTIEFIDLMKHGITPFFESLQNFIEEKTAVSSDEKPALTQNEIISIGVVIKILETQFNTLLSKGDKENTSLLDFEVNHYSEEKIKDLFMLIMHLPGITSFKVSDYELDISVKDFNCANSIYFHVIPELFVNIRKNTFLIEGTKKYKIEFDGKSLTISNPFDINYTPNPNQHKEKVEGK